MKKLSFVFLAILILSSCTKNNLNPNDEKSSEKVEALERSNRDIPYDCSNELIVSISDAIGNFFDELAEVGIVSMEEYNLRVAQLDEIDDDLSYEEQINALADIFEMEEEVAHNYFNAVNNNAALMVNPANRDALIEGIFCYVYGQDDQAQGRWIFSALANIMDVDKCSGWNIAAGVLDTAISGAATVALSTTGVGLAIGATNTAASYANTLDTALDCFG